MSNLGTAKFNNLEGYLSWYNALSVKDAEELLYKCGLTPYDHNQPAATLRRMLTVNTFFSEPEQYWQRDKASFEADIRKSAAYCETYNQPFFVQEWRVGLYAMLHTGNPESFVIILHPEEYLDFSPTPDYSGMSPAAVHAALGAKGGSSLIQSDASALTQQDVQAQLAKQTSRIADTEAQMEDVKQAKTGELAKLKEEMEAIRAKLEGKQQEMLAQLEAAKAEMERKKEQMEGQLYMLGSQIYAIRCYAGETVRFIKIRSGKDAPVTEPVVIHQKLRFLDEDLGRLASLYEIQWNDMNLFEDFLRHSPAALDTFAPNERCITLVRLSKTGKQQGRNDRLPYSNLMQDFEYFHGKTVGIIIRNGENLYLGWTDEDYVHINDDLIISQVVEETAEVPEFRFESDRIAWERNQKEERKRILDGLVSRTFVYNILQGVVDNSSILPLPQGVKLNKQSEYVRYSVADKWLSDTRFGSFTAIVEKCNKALAKGDMVLTTQFLVPERSNMYRTWENERGRGSANRTYDCSVEDCTLYPINLIEFDEPVKMLRYEYEGHIYTGRKGNVDESSCKVLEEYTERKRHPFVSVAKRESYSGARSNFELYEKEFINLTYMNSVWLEWVVNNKTLGDWRVGGKTVSYAYAIRYLKTAMDFIKKREADEKKLLDAVDASICQNPDWPLRLSEWKLEKGVRNLTEYQAKRFAAAFAKGDKK